MSIKIKYLTDSKIRSLPIQNKEALFVCSPKLYVRVHPNGSKYFEYRYTFHKKTATQTHRRLWFNHIVSSPCNG